jgi:hypothetical protein
MEMNMTNKIMTVPRRAAPGFGRVLLGKRIVTWFQMFTEQEQR